MADGNSNRNEEFFMRIVEFARERKYALDKAEALVAAATNAKRELTASEEMEYNTSMSAVGALNVKIKQLESQNTLRAQMHGGMLIPGTPGEGRRFGQIPQTKHLEAEYPDGFYDYLHSYGKRVSAAMYEGADSAGGYAVPIIVDDQIVPLAPQEMAIRQLASVIPTSSDIKIPTKTAFGTAAAKAETVAFAGTAPTLGQILLSAFMAGVQNDVSWELLQDVPVFQQFMVTDMVTAQQEFEEAWYVNGTGSGQPQGLIGNVGAGVTEEADSNGNLVSIDGTLDLIGKLNALYHKNASWLMQRATSIIIRKAQVGANLFEPVWTRDADGTDRLHGYPVAFSNAMPAAAHGACPVLFGDFKRGYVIGDRGGSGINVKVLDQPKAAQGLLTLLTYRRTDGRVRLSEAIQAYNVAEVGS
jgi:HK97 family phage major capsid protein